MDHFGNYVPHTAHLPNIAPSLMAVLEAREWTADASCSVPPHDAKTWLVEPTSGAENPRTVEQLLDVCATCPVRLACLQDVLASEVALVGAWGGTVASERACSGP